MNISLIIFWSGIFCFIAFVFWFVIRPNLYNAGNAFNMKVRDIQIKQIKKMIKELNISKKELFDD